MESIIPGTEKGICYICERRGHTDLRHCLHGIRSLRYGFAESAIVHYMTRGDTTGS